MNSIDIYIIDCISNDKKYSGKKVKKMVEDTNEKHRSLSFLYSVAKEVEIPLCQHCKKEKVELRSIKHGYRKYCSTECYLESQSERNKKNNAAFNKRKSKEIEKLYEARLQKASDFYVENELTTIKNVSDMFDLPQARLRGYLVSNGMVDSKRQNKLFSYNINCNMKEVNEKLSDLKWVRQKIDEGWSSRNFSECLNCSKNYVCVKLRENGIPLSDFTQPSSYEIQIHNILDSYGIEYQKNDRSILEGKEIDVFIKDKNIAIEINGVYWHQDYDGSKKDYHLKKTIMTESKGIRLLHFTDKELDSKIEKVDSIIKSSLGLSKKIYARTCEMKEINSKMYKEFMEKNHVQGSVNSSIRIGLFFDSELVSVMGIAKSRFDKSYQYELIRFSNNLGVNVVGGASKMFKMFINKYEPESVISYCQRRLFTGKVYEQMGMKKIKYTPPNYVWVHNNRKDDVKTRYETQKHKLKECPKEMTESEYMKRQGYMKIYDCGQIVFAYAKQ